MEILLLLIPVSVVLALLIGAAFWWSVASGQFDDLDGPAHRILADDDGGDGGDGVPAPLPEGENAGARQNALTSINPTRDGHR
jgi:cbb3-type cytochrome oxidase maturation protein